MSAMSMGTVQSSGMETHEEHLVPSSFETVNASMGLKNIHFGSTATNSQERRKLCSGQILRFIQQYEAKLCHLHIVSSQQ